MLLWVRLRAGARVRRLARRPSPLGRVAASFRAAAPGVVGGAIAGTLAFGTVGLVLGAAGGAVAPRLRARRRAAATGVLLEAQLPDVLRTVAAALRAGQSLPQAFATAHEDAPEPIRDALGAALARLGAGGSAEEAIRAFERACPTASAASAASALHIGRAAGTRLPEILDTAAAGIGDRERLAAERRAATAQARLSAAVVAGMPVAFFLLLGAAAREQLRVMLADPAGWAFLAAGAVLEAAGVLWVRRLVGARP